MENKNMVPKYIPPSEEDKDSLEKGLEDGAEGIRQIGIGTKKGCLALAGIGVTSIILFALGSIFSNEISIAIGAFATDNLPPANANKELAVAAAA